MMINLRKLNNQARWGLALLIMILATSVLAPLVSPYDPNVGKSVTLSAPSLQHLFGTDQLGRDVFVRTFQAARIDIFLALLGVGIPLVIGTLMGGVLGTTSSRLVAGFWILVIDAINAFPFIVLVIAIIAVVGGGMLGLIIGLAVTNWARYARIARARALTLRNADFVHATQVLGYSRRRVLLRHILPNVYSETLAYGLSDFVLVIIAVAGLSFLGVGLRPPAAEWGAMMADGRLYLQRQWWMTVFPGLILSCTAIGVALIAESAIRWSRGEE
jgi:peptide/nickel transport system permease protein